MWNTRRRLTLPWSAPPAAAARKGEIALSGRGGLASTVVARWLDTRRTCRCCHDICSPAEAISAAVRPQAADEINASRPARGVSFGGRAVGGRAIAGSQPRSV